MAIYNEHPNGTSSNGRMYHLACIALSHETLETAHEEQADSNKAHKASTAHKEAAHRANKASRHSAKGARVGGLLLANPQSSSTATMEQLAKMAGLASEQELSDHICAGAPDSRFYALRGHSDMCVGVSSVVDKWIVGAGKIYKQHLPPLDKNIDFVTKHSEPVVVLTRDSRASTHGLCERTLSEGKLSKDEHVIWAKPYRPFPTLTQSEAAMRDWNEGWEKVARENRDQFLVITFEAMEADREGVLQKALRHWGIKQANPFVDTHSRYVNASHSRCAAWGSAAVSLVSDGHTARKALLPEDIA